MKSLNILFVGILILIIGGILWYNNKSEVASSEKVEVSLPQFDETPDRPELIFLVKENLEVKYEFKEKEGSIKDISMVKEVLDDLEEKVRDTKIIIKIESNKVGTDSVVREVMNVLQENKVSSFSIIEPIEN